MMASKHAAAGGPSLFDGLKRRLSMVSPFAKRLGEQAAVAFAGAFWAAFEASGGSLSKAAVGAAVGAGLRAAYGLLVKNRGAADSPSVQ